MMAKSSMLSPPLASPAYILEGLKLLGHSDIRWLVIIPTLLNLILSLRRHGLLRLGLATG